MQEVLKIITEYWELTIQGKGYPKKLGQFLKAIEKRQTTNHHHSLLFSRDVLVCEATSEVFEFDNTPRSVKTKTIFLPYPLLFENSQYHVEWVFHHEIEDAFLSHKAEKVNDSFRFADTGGLPRLTGILNTGNNIGWLHLPLSFKTDKTNTTQTISIEVHPTKMDMHSDLVAMYERIDKVYPLWRFSIAKTTEQNFSESKERGYSPLIWLAQFESIRSQFFRGLKVILNSPHNSLRPSQTFKRAEQLRKICKPKTIEKIKGDLFSHRSNKSYPTKIKKLTTNTPENRFIKMVVMSTYKSLHTLSELITSYNGSKSSSPVSQHFLRELDRWKAFLKHCLSSQLLKGISPLSYMERGSLVLQNRTGYRSVFLAWNRLKFYLAIFNGETGVAQKSVAKVYEIWAFLELHRIISEDLGFQEVERPKSNLVHRGLTQELRDGIAGAFHFTRKDGIKIRLAHEPVFKRTTLPIKSWFVTQIPDILLEITYPNGRNCTWLFDAKYRLESSTEHSDMPAMSGVDFAPEDAINQMHRYRDALIYVESEREQVGNIAKPKSRPILGAFALYPGHFDQSKPVENNPYYHSISEVGIGAFPFLPSSSGNIGTEWVKQFLIDQIGNLANSKYSRNSDAQYLAEPARIPFRGMRQQLYADLLFVASVASRGTRDAEYFERFLSGQAGWYHIPLKTFTLKFARHIAREISYVALAMPNSKLGFCIPYIWKVKSLTICPRSRLTPFQSGKSSLSEEPYLLFELFPSSKLQTPVLDVPKRGFRSSMTLTTLTSLYLSRAFCDLDPVYTVALESEET